MNLTATSVITTFGPPPNVTVRNVTVRPFETGYWPDPPACQPHPHCCGHHCHGCCGHHPVQVRLACTCGPFGELTTVPCPVHQAPMVKIVC